MPCRACRPRWGRLAACIAAEVLVALAWCAAPSPADSLWRPARASHFADHRAHQPGDLVTVIIVEQASGSNQASSQTSRENKFSASGGPGVGFFSFLHPFAADANTKNDFNGSGQADVSSRLDARLTARVTGVDPAGNLLIEGSRLVAVNHDQEELTLTAMVRPDDIHADNTVLSTYLANAVIGYHGHGPNALAQHQGLISRLLNWIF